MTWQSVREKLTRYELYPENWDSHWAKKPDAEQARKAISLTWVLEGIGFPVPPTVTLGSDGNMVFEWPSYSGELCLMSNGEWSAIDSNDDDI